MRGPRATREQSHSKFQILGRAFNSTTPPKAAASRTISRVSCAFAALPAVQNTMDGRDVSPKHPRLRVRPSAAVLLSPFIPFFNASMWFCRVAVSMRAFREPGFTDRRGAETPRRSLADMSVGARSRSANAYMHVSVRSDYWIMLLTAWLQNKEKNNCVMMWVIIHTSWPLPMSPGVLYIPTLLTHSFLQATRGDMRARVERES